MSATLSGQLVGGGPEVLEEPKCVHQWLIDPPAGPSSQGVCRLCGEEREFRNYIEGTSWGYDVSIDQLSGRARFSTTSDVMADSDLGDE